MLHFGYMSSFQAFEVVPICIVQCTLILAKTTTMTVHLWTID